MTAAAYEYGALRALILTLLLPISLLVKLYELVLEWVSPAPPRWCWDDGGNPNRTRLDLWQDLSFPKGFLWGTATAAHQIEGGCTNNNWHQWECSGPHEDTGKPHILKNQKSGRAADHWNRVKEDVQLMKDIGCNSYRFSIEWSKVEPHQGRWDTAVMKHYRDEIAVLLKNGITPMVTLHHFSHPIWFDELGGWEKSENISHFLRFAEYVYAEFCDVVPFWCTFNEPTVFCLVGWLQGAFPPGKKSKLLWKNIGEAVNVLKNLLVAHVQVYKQLKSIDPSPQIGIVHNVFQMRPYRRWNPIEYIVGAIADKLQNDLVIEFLRTGTFKFSIPFVGPHFHIKMPEAPNTLDFIGLNYYSHYHMRFVLSQQDPIRQQAPPEEASIAIMTDMEYPIYAEGIYEALKRLSGSFPGTPLYITENGVADADDSRRSLFIQRYLYAISRAIKDGCDVRGYFYWTLMDNFEWAFGYDQRFGLYEVDYGLKGDGVGASLKRRLRAGSQYYIDVVKRFTSDAEDDD